MSIGAIESRDPVALAEALWIIGGHTVTPRPDCSLWTSDSDRGYGKVKVDGKTKRVHRVVWEIHHGPIAEGMTVDHLCGVRGCVNVAHMELVTATENASRGAATRQRVITRTRPLPAHCKHGHEYTSENTAITVKGSRRCRTCARESDQRRRGRTQKTEASP